jgi:predicted GNAT family acetyltransferase
MEIWQTIDKCPQGGLCCVYTHETGIELDEDNSRSVAICNREQIGECDFRKTQDGWVIYHTEVMPEHEGKGIAKRLVYKILEAADKSKVKVIPTC